ncbi:MULTISPECIES: GNAT family N-acetyltransferase [unclassified Frankia]|uniref:GNAT family N-acetyltransferase n=1 Tax=unclassified Frankia TaxID=2632575 RepID=UPI001EF51250|nr:MULTISPECIES: GNAT family N-acetyltransferase [unclassified Frankia]
MSGYSAPRPIIASDDLSAFDSGELSLDDWLRRRALGNQAAGASRCFVTIRNGRVVGYYALATGAVQRLGSSRRVGQGMPDPVPVILLGRLAADAKEQGRGLGAHLLRDAITRIVSAAEIVGVRALLVHALHDQARQFYLHFGFEPSPTHPLRLFLLMKDARALTRESTSV